MLPVQQNLPNWNRISRATYDAILDDARSRLGQRGDQAYSVNIRRQIRYGWRRGRGIRNADYITMDPNDDGGINMAVRLGRQLNAVNAGLGLNLRGGGNDEWWETTVSAGGAIPPWVFEVIDDAANFTRRKFF
jgi:hypothetical protein